LRANSNVRRILQFEHGPYMRVPEDLAKWRATGKLAFNQLPLLQIDGLDLVQTTATARYVAGKGGLLPGDAKLVRAPFKWVATLIVKAALNDMYVEGCRDFMAPFLARGFKPDDEYLTAVRAQSDKYLPFFEKVRSTHVLFEARRSSARKPRRTWSAASSP